MVTFSSLEEFRELPIFKNLKPYLRKSIIAIYKFDSKILFKIDKDRVYFKSKYISENTISIRYETKTLCQYEDIAKLLEKLSKYHFCISTHPNPEYICKIERFFFQESGRTPEFVYHTSDVEPEIILKDGIRRHFSLNLAKPFPPLVFVGTEPCWYGRYVYKIRNVDTLYIDSNMDHRRLDVRPYLCIKNNILPENIVSYILKK